ncbi:hypothetical protein G4B88_000653, partial [Cannabis sativa]
MPLSLPLSSPYIGVPVRPWAFPSSGGSIYSPLQKLTVHRRRLPLKLLVFFFTGKPLICNNFCAAVQSVFNSPLFCLLNLSNLYHQQSPFSAFPLNTSQPPAPPWLMIPSSIIENSRIPLGATVKPTKIIIRLPDMETFSINARTSLANSVLCIILSINGTYLQITTYCHSLLTFHFYTCSAKVSFALYLLNIPCSSLTMDELSNTFNATLNLTALETQILSFSEVSDPPQDDDREEPSAFLAVKLLTNHHFNSEAFKNRLKQMWPERFSINILEKEPNFYTVEFGCFGDRRRVLIGQPWHFDYKLIVMTPLEMGSTVTVDSLTFTPFWVQVSGIPFLKRSRALAQRLGEVLGRYIEVDTASLKETWGPYLRVRTEIDVSHPLPRGTGFNFHGRNLPDFCHYCGRLSHIVNHCPEFLAKCDSSSAPPLLRYDQSLGAKIRITSNPFYIACSRSRLRPHIAPPNSLAPAAPYRSTQIPTLSEGLFNEPPSIYGVQHVGQPQTTPLGFYMAHSSSNVINSPIPKLNQPPLITTTWPPAHTTTAEAPHAHTQGISNFPTQSTHLSTISLPSQTVTTAEQLPTPMPMTVPTLVETLVPTVGASHHVVPVSQAFSTILADLNSSQPLRFTPGALSSPATSGSGKRKRLKPKRPDCRNAAEQQQPSHTQECLDWCLSNNDWDVLFPTPRLSHGDFFGSDHRPLILHLLSPADQPKIPPRFIFDKLWMAEPSFEGRLRDAWTQHLPSSSSNPLISFTEKLRNCSSSLSDWKKSLGPPLATQIRQLVLLNIAMPWKGIQQPLIMEAHALFFAISWSHATSIYPDSIVSDCK